jgi:predicted aspartyl protease
MRVPALLTLLLVQSFADASAAVSLTFHLTPQGAIIVPVTVNGAESILFLLDTGANGSVISAEQVSALGLPVVAKTAMVTAAGTKQALVARVEQLGMSGVTMRGVLATVVQPDALMLPDVAASGQKVQGVIGQDVLAGLRYTIDYRRRQILWHEAGDEMPRRATALDLELQDERFVVRLPQRRDVLRLVPDSGAEALVLYHGDGRELPRLALAAGPPVELQSLTGSRAVRSAVVRTLQVGSTMLEDVPAVIVERECGAAAVDGLLPLHMFERVTFNGPGRQLLIESVSERWLTIGR